MNKSAETRLIEYMHTIRDLLSKLDDIETDSSVPIKEKLLVIKNIRDEINKVGVEVDEIKREIKLLSTYDVN